MAISYNNYSAAPTMRDRISSLLPFQRKSALPVLSYALDYYNPAVRWSDTRPSTYFRNGYKLNSAVFSCTRALANGFAEAPLLVYEDETKKKPIDKHPLRQLIKRPNEYMGEDEFWKFLIVYAANGGDGFGYMVPDNRGIFTEIWPYNSMVMWPVPSAAEWVDHYVYSIDDGVNKKDIPTEQIIHYKWAPDPMYPWRGMPALASVWREVDTDNELTRFLKVLLQNDAVTKGFLYVPQGGMPLTPETKENIKRDWRLNLGGNNRGDIAVLSGGMEYKRMSLDLNELAFDALRGVPEARIASAYGVPAIVAGLNIGLDKSTYSNFEEARKMFTEQTLVPLWKSVASEIQQSVVPFFGNDVYVDFDLTHIRALQEQQDQRAARMNTAYASGVAKLDEYRTLGLGIDEVEGGSGQVYYLPLGRNKYALVSDLAGITDVPPPELAPLPVEGTVPMSPPAAPPTNGNGKVTVGA